MGPGQLEIANLLSEVIVVSQLCMALTLACMHEERGTYDRSSACLELVTTVVCYLKTPCTAVLDEYCSCKLLQNIPSTRNGRSMRTASSQLQTETANLSSRVGNCTFSRTEHFEAQLVLVMGKSPIKMQNAPAGWQNRAIDIYYIMSKMGP